MAACVGAVVLALGPSAFAEVKVTSTSRCVDAGAAQSTMATALDERGADSLDVAVDLADDGDGGRWP